MENEVNIEMLAEIQVERMLGTVTYIYVHR